MAIRPNLQAAGVLLAAMTTLPASARLVSIHVDATQTLSGPIPYRILRGHFEGALDPAMPGNAIITDLAAAPRDGRGRVAYGATFEIALPLDPAQASGLLFYDVPNRGNGKAQPDPAGHIRVVSGWQGDIDPAPGLQTATVPIAKGANGASLTAPAMARFIDMPAGATTQPITGGIGRPAARPLPASLDPRRARLFRQAGDTDPGEAIAPADWAFADCRTVPFPGTPDPTSLCLRAGFDPHFAYTLVYQGRDPKVLGIGFAATRDLVSFLRHAKADDAGTPNPVAEMVRWTVASGTSQSGNYLKSFINLGFNADEGGAIVFDGVNPNIAARQVPLNIRFGVPGGAATLYEPGSEGTLWWGRYDDKVRGRGVSSLLDRCTASRTCPKIVETFGSTELWGLRMAPGLIGTDARADLPLPANVRRYYFPGVTHGGSSAGGISLDGDKPWPGAPQCSLAWNPNPSAPTLRALQAALIAWVETGKAPPPSRYPTIAAGELVPADAKHMGWPAIPGAPTPDGKLNVFLDYDFGPGFHYADLSGVLSRLPPGIRRTIPALVPRVDADGNETAGVPSVQHLVPLGTYLGWNVLAQGYGTGGPCSFVGGFIPFAHSRAERERTGDPRPSLEERYRDHAGFVARVRAVADRQVAAGWLLSDDAARIVADAEASAVLKP
ncbi:alpha/beta hydrolase domain-containing protein [Sphingomonas sp. MMS24-J13]|uniref:alpha/beta hydrolase domain-containing protein n=1 Tax=Sphingomonas sp. MMS24-J13 TaxID=3238686 RepID=UPI00384C267D